MVKEQGSRTRGLYQREPGSGIWWIRYADASGRIRREKAGTKSAAIKLYNKRKAEALQGRKLPENLRHSPAPSLRNFSKGFLDSVQVRSAAKPRTAKFYAEQVRRLLEYEPLANARLDEIDEALVERYVQYRSSKFARIRTKEGLKETTRQISPATVNRALATLRRMLRLARRWHVIGSTPEIRPLRGERNREYVLGYAEEEVYLEFAAQPLRDVALLVIDTGLRIGEALALEWSDVHFAANGSEWGYIQVQGGKSKNARRAVPLTRRVYEMLTQRRASCSTVFADTAGSRYSVSYLDHLHAKIRTALKLPKEFVLHSLRHTYLTRLGLSGADAFTIMRLAGHSSVSVSQRYVHPTPQAMEDAVSRMDRMNARWLQSNRDSGQDSGRATGFLQARNGPTGTTTDTDLLPDPQVIDGRVAQLAEQLTLNQ